MTSTPNPYAKGTTVSVEKSRAEIDTLLGKHGATHRGIQTSETAAQVAFVIDGRKYRIDVPLPERLSATKVKPAGWHRWNGEQCERWSRAQHEQACRERWRCVVLLLKSKLELVRIGMSSVEKEFLADLVLPNGETAGQAIGAYMERLIAEGYTAPLALPEST